MDPNKLLDWLKLPTKTLAAICIATGILIFSNQETLENFGLKDFVLAYRGYFGVAFLLAFALTIVNFISAIWKFIYPWIAEAYWIHGGRKRLKNLNPTEKRILRYYIVNQTRSQNLPVQDGSVNALQKEKIIIQGSLLGTMRGFDFVIQPWAWEYLNEHPELLE